MSEKTMPGNTNLSTLWQQAIQQWRQLDKNKNGKIELQEILENGQGVIKLTMLGVSIVFGIIALAQTVLQWIGVVNPSPILITAATILCAVMFVVFSIIGRIEKTTTASLKLMNENSIIEAIKNEEETKELKKTIERLKANHAKEIDDWKQKYYASQAKVNYYEWMHSVIKKNTNKDIDYDVINI